MFAPDSGLFINGINSSVEPYHLISNRLDLSRVDVYKQVCSLLERQGVDPQKYFPLHTRGTRLHFSPELIMLPMSSINPLKNHIFSKPYYGFNFTHGLTFGGQIHKNPEFRNLSTVFIDDRAIAMLREYLGPDKCKSLIDALGGMYLIANHDYSIHRLGVSRNTHFATDLSFSDPYNDIASIPGIAPKYEVAAGAFHLDMINEIGEENEYLRNHIRGLSRECLELLSMLHHPELKKYFTTVFKYPFFSIHGTSSTKEKDFLAELLADFPDITLSETRWSRAINVSKVRRGESSQSLRDFRKEKLSTPWPSKY